MKRNVFAVIAFAGAAALVSACSGSPAAPSPSDAAGKPPTSEVQAPKVAVCHRTNGTNAFVQIEVSGNALQTHLDHGDQLPTVGNNFCQGL